MIKQNKNNKKTENDNQKSDNNSDNNVHSVLQLVKKMFVAEASFLGNLSTTIVFLIASFFYFLPLGERVFLSIFYATIIVIIVRLIFPKQRPNRQQANSWFTRIDAASFPSLHCTRAAILATIFGSLLNNTYVRIILAILVCLVAYSRIAQKKHDIWDCLAGIVLGIIIGVL